MPLPAQSAIMFQYIVVELKILQIVFPYQGLQVTTMVGAVWSGICSFKNKVFAMICTKYCVVKWFKQLINSIHSEQTHVKIR
mmetsp:Transcript_10060/g.16081  ORF Transcript_10060/g.16081 Transcript_10060/m.16081 type:complete len:82 (-) Transcript_10060:637-882(-)